MAARERLLVDPTTNVVEAYLLYLHGRFSWNQRTEQGLRDAIRLYQQALAHDDTYARAWAGLADAYIILGNFSWELPDSAYPRAREAVTHSLALAPQLEEAHVAAARIAMWYDHDWPAAELAFVKALQLDRNVAFGHYWFSAFLDATGQHERAEAGLALAERLDPLAPQIAAGVAHHYFWTRDFQRAIAVIEAVLNEHPTFANGYSYLGQFYCELGAHEDALRQFARADSLFGRRHTRLFAALTHARSGRPSEARALLNEELVDARQRGGYINPTYVGRVHAALGDHEAAFTWIRRAIAEHDPKVLELAIDPRWDPLKRDARWRQVVTAARLGSRPMTADASR